MKALYALVATFLFTLTGPILANPSFTPLPSQLMTPRNGGSDGGQFSYQDVLEIFESSKAPLAHAIENAPLSELQDLETRFKIRIDWQKFAQVIKSARAEPSLNMPGVNEQGYRVPKDMHYDRKLRLIYALQPFFSYYTGKEISDRQRIEIFHRLLHEASHIFGLGINNSTQNYDHYSRKFSQELYSILIKTWNDCGLNGSLEQRIANCKTAGTNKNTPRDQSWSLVFQGSLSRLLILRHEATGVLVTSVVTRSELSHPRPTDFCDHLPNDFATLGSWTLPTPDELLGLLSKQSAPSQSDLSRRGKSIMHTQALDDCYFTSDPSRLFCSDQTFISLKNPSVALKIWKEKSSAAAFCIFRPRGTDGHLIFLPSGQIIPKERTADWFDFFDQTVKAFTGWDSN